MSRDRIRFVPEVSLTLIKEEVLDAILALLQLPIFYEKKIFDKCRNDWKNITCLNRVLTKSSFRFYLNGLLIKKSLMVDDVYVNN
ncbi:unnamed protein product [Rhizophagus irregularis]|nr:unnamed protein product [Rhizophagus irregularis]